VPATTAWPRLRRFSIRLAILALILAAILVGGYGYIRSTGGRELESALAETDRLDPYWRLEDLEAHRRPRPPLNENGFEHIMAAMRVAPSKPWPQPSFPQFDSDRDYQKRVVAALTKSLKEYDQRAPVLLNEEEDRVLRAELERGKETVAMLRKMVDFSTGRGPSLVPARGTLLPVAPPYMEAWRAGTMLAADARVRIQDSDIARALHDASALLHISWTLAEEPHVVAQVVRRGLDWLAAEVLERTLAGGVASEVELASLQRELERPGLDAGYDLVFRGSRAFYDRILEDAQTGAISWSELRGLVYPATPIEITARIEMAVRFAILCSNIAVERARFLRRINALIAISRAPLHERQKAYREMIARMQQQSSRKVDLVESFSEVFFSASIMELKYAEDELDSIARVLCARAGLAAERFRLANQRWPQNLEELTPKWLKAVPIDPFSGAPLQMVRKGSSLIIYSIGSDQKDDGGSLERINGVQAVDVGFVLHDPAERRRAGAPFVFPKR
jgi:hypothetical protein